MVDAGREQREGGGRWLFGGVRTRISRVHFCTALLHAPPAPQWDLTVMNEGRTVFAQLMDQLTKYELDKCIARYGGNRRMRSFSTYEQFLTMAFCPTHLS